MTELQVFQKYLAINWMISRFMVDVFSQPIMEKIKMVEAQSFHQIYREFNSETVGLSKKGLLMT